MPDGSVGVLLVAYGIERMNFQVSNWMRGLSESDLGPQLPFIATRGYDSVVWSRLYSRDVSDLDDYQISQARACNSFKFFILLIIWFGKLFYSCLSFNHTQKHNDYGFKAGSSFLTIVLVSAFHINSSDLLIVPLS